MSYNIEIRLANKKGWHTPAEARAYYGKYSRDGITVHWWNTPDKVKDSDHDNIANYILGKAQRGQGSVNYVLSNNKITLLVNPDNVAWASQAGNPTTVSVEFSPHLNAEGYKKAGWLINELFNPVNGRYRKAPRLWKHSDWYSTQCPGSLDLNRMLAEANKWATGAYNPKPQPPKPTPVPPTVDNLTWHLWKEGEIEYVFNKDTHLYDIDTKTWGGIKNVKPYKKGEKVTIVGHIHNKALDRDYYITRYTFDEKNSTGFNPADLDIYVPPTPPTKPPTPPEPDPEDPFDPTPVEPTDPPAPVEPPTEPVPMWFIQLIKDLVAWISGKLGLGKEK